MKNKKILTTYSSLTPQINFETIQEHIANLERDNNNARKNFLNSLMGVKVVVSDKLKGDDYFIMVSQSLYDELKKSSTAK